MRRASIGSAARLVFMRDMTLAWRRWDEVAQPLIFYVVVTTLFPLATTPDLQQLREIAPGVIWVAALLASLLALESLFRSDVEDGTMEPYAMISDTQQMDTTKGTLFGAYNAVTGYYQNVRNYKNDEAKLQSIVMGGTAQLKTQKAFELCTSFATDGAEILSLN